MLPENLRELLALTLGVFEVPFMPDTLFTVRKPLVLPHQRHRRA